MSAIVPHRGHGLSRADSRKLSLFKATVGKELRGAEIDEAVEWCEIYGANPFVRDIYFFVFDATKASRNVVPVLGIGLYRKIAARSKAYRPDTRPARFVYDENLRSEANPKGMVSCEVSVFVHAHGEWFEVSERLCWDERAPIKEIWENDKPTGRFTLDKKKKNWRDMPETMMAKCVEAAAIRKAFPEETAGSYSEGELDQAEVINLTATEIIERSDQQDRLERIGGPNAITVDWCDGRPLVREPVGTFGDKVLAFIKENQDEPSTVCMFHNRNTAALQEYWVKDKSGALALKQAFEAQQQLEAAE